MDSWRCNVGLGVVFNDLIFYLLDHVVPNGTRSQARIFFYPYAVTNGTGDDPGLDVLYSLSRRLTNE